MKKTLFTTSIYLLPAVAFAASDLKDLIDGTLIPIVQSLTALLVGLAVLYFFWGMATFILNSADEKGREEGKQKMIWGIIALFVMVSVWGIIAILETTFFDSSGGQVLWNAPAATEWNPFGE